MAGHGDHRDMGVALGLVMIAIGAFLRFAVHGTMGGATPGSVGIILMVTGGFGVLMDLWLIESRRPPSG